MARPPVDPSRPATPERILDAATEVFARDGFVGARLAEIAAGAEVKRPSLLYHFATKQVLYEAVVRRTFSRLGDALGEVMAREGAFAERLRGVALTYASYIAGHPSDARIVVQEMTGNTGPGQAILIDQVTPLLDAVVRFIEREGDGALRPGLLVRHAVLQVAASELIAHAASDDVRAALWGPADPSRTATLATTLFLTEEVS
ncbi:MAG: TetR/AcrR family transcriptional regulator [Myxococcota bacterium]